MNDELFTEVSKYIDDNILQSVLWDSSDETVKRKAANNAYESLARLLPDVFADKEIEVDDIAQQAVFLLKIDDSFQRAELGVVQMSIDGMTLIFRDSDYTIAPYISGKYGITVVNGKRRRTASYRVDPFSSYRIPIDNSRKRSEWM
ncbi:hypothetical protein [Enterococcus gallinarum]|uniref:hypothetical protein n=1 Tax=Enterococcus gallinarum TaxID=1353 RepID=UPI002495EFED|nr:hypothetical protein [Enterococcus gallinarum]GMG60048.1 hypothetical protein AH4_33930 [Enterococcus gallinarum]